MAYLRNLETNAKIYLLNHHSFGRYSKAVDTYIPQLEISRIHAVIKWSGLHWQIRDLSSNGTWLDKKRVPSAQDIIIKEGQTIRFANQENQAWKVENLDGPSNLLLGLNEHSDTIAIGHYHLLPNDKKPLAAIFFCYSRGQWILDTHYNICDVKNDQSEKVITSNDTIEIGAFQWQLLLSIEESQTVKLTTNKANNEHCEFFFDVSLDDKHTKLSLKYEEDKVDLGEHNHHALLLHLARLKAKDAKQGIEDNKQGWINNQQLAKELGIEVTHIDIQIFRARKQIAEAFPSLLNITSLLQRAQGEIRFNCPQAQISQGQNIETLSI